MALSRDAIFEAVVQALVREFELRARHGVDLIHERL
jgi:hypothetical protein